MKPLTLGYSPCPNDTHIFYPLIHGRIDSRGLRFRERLEDVETLNQLALTGTLDVSKVSCHAAGLILDEYCILRSGGAFGRGCGPLVVSRGHIDMASLKGKRVALPGRYTTASLLFQIYGPGDLETLFMPFHEIMGAVSRGEADAGVIIHESRFTFASYGLKNIMDLGVCWESETGYPIPLGCIVARRSLGENLLSGIDRALRESVAYAGSDPDEALAYIRRHAYEMSDEVCAAHIRLYVNDFSLDLGPEGMAALTALLARAAAKGLAPESVKKIFYQPE
ncbi:MAG: 1,4-dihydroxy-6-naphthoate synthase [Deltaproteobacteria bacterium]